VVVLRDAIPDTLKGKTHKVAVLLPFIFRSTTALLHEIIKRKANWIGHILRRNCLLKHVIEVKIKGQIGVTKRQGRRRKK